MPRPSGPGRRVSVPGGPAYPGYVPSVYGWLRRHPWQVDTIAAVVLVACGSGEWTSDPTSGVLGSRAGVALVSVLLAATVVPRRRYPVPAFAVAAAIAGAQIFGGIQPQAEAPVHVLQPTMTDLAVVVLLYTLAAYRPRRVSLAGLAVCLAGAGLAVSRWGPAYASHGHGPLFAGLAGLTGLAVSAWVIGDSMAYRRAYYAALEDRAERLEAERDAQARIAAAAERARELQERRARVVDESAARLRRIERDLHDGAQVRLAALALALGEIKENLATADGADDRQRTPAMVSAAHRNAKETLAELRDLARGIHPPVLDRGLGAALSALAESCATPVELTVGAPERPSPAIETIAYFCAAELMANAAKHSGADRTAIGVSDQGGRLLMTVTDNGTGGARFVPGGGLAGLRERVQTVDGRLDIDSPDGGPTIITVELPEHA